MNLLGWPKHEGAAPTQRPPLLNVEVRTHPDAEPRFPSSPPQPTTAVTKARMLSADYHYLHLVFTSNEEAKKLDSLAVLQSLQAT